MDTTKLIAWSVFAACLFVVAPREPDPVKDGGPSAVQAAAPVPQPNARASSNAVHTARAETEARRRATPARRIGG